MVIKKIKKHRYRIELENESFFINQKLYTFSFWREEGDVWRHVTKIKSPNIFEALRSFRSQIDN